MTRKERMIDFFSKLSLIDVLALLPLEVIFVGLEPKYNRLMYLLKILRVFNGFSALDQSMFMKDIKMLYNKKIEIIIKYNQKLARNYKKDNNNIAKIIFISYLLRASILILNLLCFSYFVGLMWFIICDLQLFEETENFIDYFDVYEKFNS